MTEQITIRRATLADFDKIVSILQEASIESAELEKWIESFILAEGVVDNQQQIIATAGLEKYGKKGLLRSLVIRKKAWTVEDGLQMMQLIFAYAGNNGLEELYLLTQSPNLFIHMGFAQIPNKLIPADLLASVHFRQNLQRAVPMRKILN